MPELPEVEVIRRGLHNHLPGCKVLGIVAGNKKLRLPMPRKYLKNHIQGARIKSVDRRAKFLLIAMDNGASLIVHLGMTGRLDLRRILISHQFFLFLKFFTRSARFGGGL